MSVQAMAAVWRYSQAKGASLLVLLALADEASDQGTVSAYNRTRRHLATKTHSAMRTVTRALADLEELGEIEVLIKGTGRTTSNYQIHLPGMAPRVVNVTPDEGRSDVLPDVTAGPGTGDTRSPEGRSDVSPLLIGSPFSTHSSPTPSPSAGAEDEKAKRPKGASAEARQVAQDFWESREVKPVCGFMALVARVQDCLDAGYTPEAVAKVLPTMGVFSRDSFDRAFTIQKQQRPGRQQQQAHKPSEKRDEPPGRLSL